METFSDELSITLILLFYLIKFAKYRVSQKKGDLCLKAHKTPCKRTRDKSRVTFGKFRKFPYK